MSHAASALIPRPQPLRQPRLSIVLDRGILITDREAEVLTLVAMGRSNAEIAGDLFLAVATVKSHVSNLLMKLQQRDRAQLVVLAYTSGFMGAWGVATTSGRI